MPPVAGRGFIPSPCTTRPLAQTLRLDVEGAAIHHWPSAARDFRDEGQPGRERLRLKVASYEDLNAWLLNR